jgi:hypothetical protein
MKKINLFDNVYVFSNWGIVSGKVCEILESGIPRKNGLHELNPLLYKVTINIDNDNQLVDHEYYYREEDVYKTLEHIGNACSEKLIELTKNTTKCL